MECFLVRMRGLCQEMLLLSGSAEICAFQEKVLAESKAMIPDTKQRLEAAAEDLKKLLVRTGWVQPNLSIVQG